MKNKASIIIRTKDEERWITQVLKSVFNQTYRDFEVIIVDNESSDKTIEKARQFNIAEIITCKDYMPGKALNMGIRRSKGDYIVCLSGHCIPTNDKWLERLISNFEDLSVAGVYGRQEPMSFTPDSDKRDLALVFGLDRKIQAKDSFFHNANSAIRRKVWERMPFSETVTNIEDRVWAKEVLESKNTIVYDPDASVFHYHGIHQNGDVERCANVVRILERLHEDNGYKPIDMDKMNVVAIIPVRGPVRYLNGKPLISYTIERARESRFIKKVIVSTDCKETAEVARSLGALVPFMREPSFSDAQIDLAKVLKYSLEKIEGNGILPDIIVSLEVTFPFRPKGLLDDMIAQMARNGFDSVVATRRENRSMWKERDGEIVQLDEGMVPRQFKDPSFIGLKGVGCVTHPVSLRNGKLLGKRVGIYEVNNPYSHLEVRSDEDHDLASLIIDKYFG